MICQLNGIFLRIQNFSLKNNITFGKEFIEQKYRRVIKSCALEQDLKILPNGDETEIGEKGINLSGGQKQRVSLARAVYYDADIIFLDDPLSAVDAHVGKYIFEECICGLLKGRTRVLVTHQLHFLPEVDYIYFMHEGKIQEQGTFADLCGAEGNFAKLMKEYGGVENADEADDELGDAVANGSGELGDVDVIRKSIRSSVKKEDDPKKPSALMTSEERAVGAVSWPVYWDYFKEAGGYVFLSLVLFCTLFSQGTKLANDYWLSFWTG